MILYYLQALIIIIRSTKNVKHRQKDSYAPSFAKDLEIREDLASTKIGYGENTI